MPVQSVEEAMVAVGRLLDKGCKQVIITLGASGAVFASQDNSVPVHVPTKSVKPVDTTVGSWKFIYISTSSFAMSFGYQLMLM
jgi:fructose-1-phosphate kinase PfkB-like protein